MRTDHAFIDVLAKAILAELPSNDGTESVLHEFEAVAEALHADREGRALASLIQGKNQIEALDKALADRVSAPVKNAVLILAGRGLLHEVARLPDVLKRLREESGAAREVEVQSVAPLAAHEREDIRRTLHALWGVPVILRERINPGLLGGVRLRSGDWQYDASVSGKLRRLKQHLTSS